MALFVRYTPIILGGGGAGGASTVGTIDSVTPSSNGAVINGSQLFMQSASASVPGLINNASQTFSGAIKTFVGSVVSPTIFPNAVTYGAVSSFNIADLTANNTAIQTAINAFTANGGNLIINKGVAWDPTLLTLRDEVNILDYSGFDYYSNPRWTGQIKFITQTADPGLKNANELQVIGNWHPALVVDNQGPAVDESRSSIMFRQNGVFKWEIGKGDTALDDDFIIDGATGIPGGQSACLQIKALTYEVIVRSGILAVGNNAHPTLPFYVDGTSGAPNALSSAISGLVGIGQTGSTNTIGLFGVDGANAALWIQSRDVRTSQPAGVIELNPLGGQVTAGTPGGVFGTNEQLSALYTTISPVGGVASAGGINITGNTANSATGQGGRFKATRTTTGTATDSGALIGLRAGAAIANASNAYSNSNFVSAMFIDALSTGATAPAFNYASLYLNDDATSVTGYKQHILLGSLSGGTNNAQISDNQAYTGNYFINQSGTIASILGGQLSVNGIAASASALLLIGGATNPLTSTTQVGVTSNYTSSANATSSIRGFQSATKQAPSITTSVAYSFLSTQCTLGAGSTITTQIEFAGLASQNATNNAVLADNNAFTGNFFVNQSGTSPSVFGGTTSLKILKFGTAGTTGSTVNILGTNGPNVTTTPNTWVAVQLSDGSTGYVPVWK